MAATEVTAVVLEALVGGESTNVTAVVLEALAAPDLNSTIISAVVLEVLTAPDRGADVPLQGERLALPRGWQGGPLRWRPIQGALRRK